MAHVVADLVRAELGQLDAEADARGAPVARQRARDQPVDADVERIDQRLGHRARTLPRRGRLPAASLTPRTPPLADHAGGSGRVAAPGSGTAATTLSITSSAVTPSLRAS